jgi:hypothetical protein
MVEMTGSTGNIYSVCIARQPSCDCPHAKAGHQCKHVLYVMARVLRAKFDYVYQLALLNTELQDIFANAPPPMEPGPTGTGSSQHDKNRKPIEGDCPICFDELAADGGEDIVWCRATCGQNVHKECFEMWAATKRQGKGGRQSEVTCPYCRSIWQGDDDMVKKIKKTGPLNHEGYFNIADQLGISAERGKSQIQWSSNWAGADNEPQDTSTYSEWWPGHGRRRGRYSA